MSYFKIIGWNKDLGISTIISDGESYREEKFEIDRLNQSENALRYSLVAKQIKHLQGEVLTILEASIDDERKLKATKNLVNDKISSKLSWLYELCGLPEGELEKEIGEGDFEELEEDK